MLLIAIAAVLTLGAGMAGAYTRGREHTLNCADYSYLPACEDAFDQSTAPPRAEITPDHAVVNTPTAFTGDLANGPGGDRGVTGYAWDFGHGDTSTEAHPVRTFAANGEYEVQLTLTLGDGTTASTTEELRVTDAQPLGMFVYADDETVTGAPLNLEADVYDPDNQSSTGPAFDWDFGDGSPVAHDAQPAHAYASAGDYKLTVTAHLDGKTASRSHWILVGQTRPADECDGPSDSGVQVGRTTSIECYGDVSSGQIDFGDGSPPVTGAFASHTYTTVGTYDAKATLTMRDGSQIVRRFWVDVVPVPPRSVAAGYAMTRRPHAGAPVSLYPDATGFDDDTATYTWSFGDGTPNQQATDFGGIDHTYASAGLYKATVTAHDSGGPDLSSSVWIPVDPADIPRVVGLGLPDEVDSGQAAEFMAGVYDEDGITNQAAYQWSFDGVVDPADTDAFAPHTFATAGTHTAKVVVSEPSKPTVQREKTFSVAAGTPPSGGGGGGGGGGTPPASGGGATPLPAPGGASPAPAPAKPGVSGALPKRGSLAKGIKVGLKCTAACTLKATLTLPKSLARRYKLKGALATGSLHLTKAGSGTIKLKASKAARKLLRKLKGKTVTLTVTGGRTSLHRQIKLTG